MPPTQRRQLTVDHVAQLLIHNGGLSLADSPSIARLCAHANLGLPSPFKVPPPPAQLSRDYLPQSLA